MSLWKSPARNSTFLWWGQPNKKHLHWHSNNIKLKMESRKNRTSMLLLQKRQVCSMSKSRMRQLDRKRKKLGSTKSDPSLLSLLPRQLPPITQDCSVLVQTSSQTHLSLSESEGKTGRWIHWCVVLAVLVLGCFLEVSWRSNREVTYAEYVSRKKRTLCR